MCIVITPHYIKSRLYSFSFFRTNVLLTLAFVFEEDILGIDFSQNTLRIHTKDHRILWNDEQLGLLAFTAPISPIER